MSKKARWLGLAAVAFIGLLVVLWAVNRPTNQGDASIQVADYFSIHWRGRKNPRSGCPFRN